MKMNFKVWAVYLLALVTVGVTFSACSDDDDDNGPAFNPQGKRLVSRIYGENPDDPDDTEDVSFKYNGEGEITTIDWKSSFYSDDLDRKCAIKEHFTFSVSGSKLKIVHKYEDEEDPSANSTDNGEFLLNEDGYIESGEETFDDSEFTYEFTYDGDYLAKEVYKEDDRYSRSIYYNWDNGDIVSGNYSPSYYDKVNKANIDFGDMEYTLLGNTCSYLEFTGFLGRHNKHLVKSISSTTFKYEYDDEGYVTKFTTKEGGFTYVYKVSYN